MFYLLINLFHIIIITIKFNYFFENNLFVLLVFKPHYIYDYFNLLLSILIKIYGLFYDIF